MIYRYDNFYQEINFKECEYLVQSISEEISFGGLRDLWNRIVDRFSSLSQEKKRKILHGFIISAIAIAPISDIIRIVLSNQSDDIKEEVVQIIDEEINFLDATNMRLSQRGRDLIKDHEGFRSAAYKIGDGMITVGWGHAEPINKSKYKVGQEITLEEANMLLSKDLTEAADGVRRMFKEWKDSGNYIPISQDMFDVLVSLSYNVGVSGLRRSDVVKYLEKGEYEMAGELIRTFRISKKFKGLSKRRSLESKIFLSFM